MPLPRLLFAHANGFTGASYKSFLAPLGSRFDLHPLDRLGHDPAHPVSDNWAALRDELVMHLRAFDAPVIGVGHSMGGVLMLMAADMVPQALRCVVMLDSPLMVGLDALALRAAKRFKMVDRVTPAGRSKGRRQEWPNREAMGHYLRQRRLFKPFTEAALQDYIEGGTRARNDGSVELLFDPGVEVDIFRSLPDHLQGLTQRVNMPLALIAGERSDLLTSARRRRLKRHGVPIVTTPGSHMFPMEHPDEARATLMTTIDSLLENRRS
ncbi:alpha/beta fold hydrolase [Halomonas sp. M20]|uniref:alpha/beta fold hydrolase n=1 Tax=Halomonas sp. M20 TaxID=2763264 RepID=UPI001D0A56A3|nr:alpha/beta hydrolase [Halomonas sp. M20]